MRKLNSRTFSARKSLLKLIVKLFAQCTIQQFLVVSKATCSIRALVRRQMVFQQWEAIMSVVSTILPKMQTDDGVQKSSVVLCSKSKENAMLLQSKLVEEKETSSLCPQMLQVLSQWVDSSTCHQH